jgi:YbbR domain-containing protein
MIERILQRGTWVKVLAVLLALYMWYETMAGQWETRVFDLRLEFSEAPGKIVTFKNPDMVRVTFEGLARALDKIDPARLTVPVDISSLEPGTNQVPIRLDLPVGGVTVSDIYPQVAVVALDVKETKPVSVKVETRGVPNEEFEAQAPVPDITVVEVSGPRTQVETVASVFGTVDISGAAGTIVDRMVPLTAVDAQNNTVPNVEVNPSQVSVSVPMKSRPPAKMVPVRAETRGAPKTGYRVKAVHVSPSSAKIRGESSVTGGLSYIATEKIDVTDRTQTFTYPANLVIPQGVTSETVRVNVTVEIEEDIVQKTFAGVFVQIQSLPVGYAFNLEPTTVDITIEGRRDVIQEIERNVEENSDYLEAFIDASWIKEPGSHKMVVNVRGLPSTVRFESIVPSHVILELRER